MQHGVPCISTCEGGVSGIIEDGHTGLLAERMNAEDLAAKMEMLLNDKALRESMGRHGREKFVGEFSLCKFENRLGEILSLLTE